MSRKGEKYVEVELVKDSSYYKGKIIKQVGFAVIAFIVTYLIMGPVFQVEGLFTDAFNRIIFGIFFMSIPSGWSAISSIFGKWIITNITLMLAMITIKFILALILGWILFPITLIYNIVMLVRKNKDDSEDVELA